MRVRSLLAGELFDPVFQHSPVAAQFSSLGMVDSAWLHKFKASFGAGSVQGGGPADSAGKILHL